MAVLVTRYRYRAIRRRQCNVHDLSVEPSPTINAAGLAGVYHHQYMLFIFVRPVDFDRETAELGLYPYLGDGDPSIPESMACISQKP